MARAADDAGFGGALADAGGVTTTRAFDGVGADGTADAAEAGAETVALGTAAEGAFETTGGASAELPVAPVAPTFAGSATGPPGDGGELTRVTRMAMTTAASAMPAPVTKSFTGLLATSEESARVVASAGEDDAMLRPSAGASLPLGAWGLGWVTFANS